METSQLAQFGYQHQGNEWVMPRPRFFTAIMYIAGGLLTLIGVVLSGVAISQEAQGIGGGQGDLVAGIVVLLLLLGAGITFLLFAVRFRQAVDVRQRAFIMQGAFARTVLPFDHITDVRPVNLTVNGAYQGLHYEAFSQKKPYAPGKRGLKISPSFRDQDQAEQFGDVLENLLR